ncbi:uncharacterized protein LOC116295046 isoform X1 [Actinia tenebrosa]|uniref:Uncharacterized protein LOC116295046 isoform X1 n=1 Tax=Actinia tenebrosa TaxID=6105 RepID=A0A6P8I147_ACTTE|nr:uncharacterized protein LOC116295046 isoform X1 [Actinia tenebrosa]
MGNFVGRDEQPNSEKDIIELRIYEIVEKLYPEHCEKITGMLLEVDENELKELLENQEELSNRIERAAMVVRQTSTVTLVPTHDIGNKVYGTVQQLYPVFARQITGMLLELGEGRLVELLDNKDQFIEHIHKAAAVTMETEVNKKATRKDKNTPTQKQDNDISKAVSLEEEQEKEQLACQIFLKVVNQHPNTADRITGMLLEMDIPNLREINNDNEILMEKVSQAVQALGEEEKSCGSDDKENTHGSLGKQENESFLRQIESELNLSNLKRRLVGLDDDIKKELIGEELYKILLKIYPHYADKITGMLLEMDMNILLETLANPELLQNRVEQAVAALDDKS